MIADLFRLACSWVPWALEYLDALDRQGRFEEAR
jgi:hypothetical protein